MTSLYLLPHHEKMLRVDSGIAPAVSAERGCRSVESRAELAALGYDDRYQCRPGLLLPLFNVDGEQFGSQLRPDLPRLNARGKPIKYETPAGQKNRIDVHPRVFPLLLDPTQPLWLTEGVKKADCLTSHGAPAIDLAGVWNWVGPNQYGGKTTLSDWREIALNGREIILAFDVDFMVNPMVRRALLELADMLTRRHAKVRYAVWGEASDAA